MASCAFVKCWKMGSVEYAVAGDPNHVVQVCEEHMKWIGDGIKAMEEVIKGNEKF